MEVYKFREYEVTLDWAEYGNNNTALQLLDEEGGLVVTVTVNVDEVPDKDIIGVKNYSENKGMVDFLVGNGLIEEEPEVVIYSGFVEVPYHRLTEKAIQSRDKQRG